MNGNLAYLQLAFTVESQANLAADCMVMQEKSKSFRGPRQPPTPPAYFTPRLTAFGRMRHTALQYFKIFTTALQFLELENTDRSFLSF